jgi:hypothetical protein
MTFDSRSRRAVQGIRRAVEVMEMSSTKTPQKLTRFDQYRERKSRNQRIVALVVGIAFPILLIAGAWRLFGSGGTGTPADQPTTPTVSASVTQPPVSGRSHKFNAPFTYTVPADWQFSGDGHRSFSLETPDASSTDVILLSNVVAAAPDDCSTRPAPEQGVGTSSEAMTRWLSTNPALDATEPHPVRLGAATGSYVDIQLAKTVPCSNGLPLVTAQPDDIQWWSIYGSWKERVYVLDLPSGDTVTIVLDEAASPIDFRSLIDEAAPVVESFRFLK